MKINAYKIYGHLAHEKRPVYSLGRPDEDIYDTIALDIPDDIYDGKNEAGEALVNLDGTVYRLCEVLASYGESPALRWYNGTNYRYILLKEADRE